MTRRTFAQVEAQASKATRTETIAECCRVLKHHLGMQAAADALYLEMQKPTPKRESAAGAKLMPPWPIYDPITATELRLLEVGRASLNRREGRS